jgi:hypothetical protein
MKNIYVLPTDKPSSIGYDGVKNLHFVNDFIDDYQNIFITSDEEIKEGDWCYDNWNRLVKVNKLQVKKANDYYSQKLKCLYWQKIILTTDQDLIKDGVQAIDDEFLEWFVKNPSCEEIKLDYIGYVNAYNIIIPKEEPKFENSIKNSINVMSIANSMFGEKEEPKQETLEEAAINKYGTGYGAVDSVNAFIEGAKWQQERMYSEEEVGELVYNIIGKYENIMILKLMEQK